MAALALVVAVVGIGASSVLGARSGTQTTTVKVKAGVGGALKFSLSRRSAPHGTTVFVVTNVSSLPHDFLIAGKKTPVLSKGKTKAITVKLSKGKHAYKCTVDGHAAAGMKGVFTST
jgi:uncharacterized cupredoxin-like copper-binding protein